MKKSILVCGGAGFIGHHLARRLKEEGHTVIVADIRTSQQASEFAPVGSYCTYYEELDLTSEQCWLDLEITYGYSFFDEIYQLAADMGGAGYIFSGENDADVMTNSALINLHCVDFCRSQQGVRVFYSSSACMYPQENQVDPMNPKCSEDSAYPANPDSEYGWEKLFSERLYLAHQRNKSLDVRIARFHNIFGPEGSWNNGKEKAPAAICRKVAEALRDGEESIEIWGDGTQTRSFLYIDDCLDAVQSLMASEDFFGPVNIGSEEMISINNLAYTVMELNPDPLVVTSIKHIEGPIGVKGRNSDNRLIREKLRWGPKLTLCEGISKTYDWIKEQVNA